MRKEELPAFLLAGIAQDPQWSIHPELTHDGIKAWHWARTLLGLPEFPRAGRHRVSGDGLPRLFAFVKSKCFSKDGTHVCPKQGHSCMRRIIDTCSLPFARGWQTMGRAVRATVEFSGVTREVFSAAAAGPALQRLVRGLPRAAPGTDRHCRRGRCGVVLEGLQLVIADVDQAFEACQGHAVAPAWHQVAEEYRMQYDTNHVLAQRGPRYQAKIGGKQ